MARDFQNSFFTGRYEPDFEDGFQPGLIGRGINQFVKYRPDNIEALVAYIFTVAKQENLHPNDIVILSSDVSLMRKIDLEVRKGKGINENTLTTFESEEAYSSGRLSREQIEKIRSNKKYGFNLNSGLMKICTIHSFKGYEVPTVFLIVDERDSPELVYVGITRASMNLIVFVQRGSKYESFFSERLESIALETC